MNWQEEYKSKLVTAEEAVKIVKSGDTVFSGPPDEPKLLLPALAKRRDELKDVNLIVHAPSIPQDMYQQGWEDSFSLTWQNFITAVGRSVMDERRADYLPLLFSKEFFRPDEGPVVDLDVFFVLVSPPDEHGFCSFGISMWNKKSYCKRAKKVIAEVDSGQLRTGGDNFIHVSEIDYFVEHTPPRLLFSEIDEAVAKVAPPESRKILADFLRSMEPVNRPRALEELASLKPEEIGEHSRFTSISWEPTEVDRAIAENVKPLIRNGQSIQVGQGAPSGTLVACGVFDDKVDLGFWSELCAPGIAELAEAGVLTGRYNPHRPGKLVAASFQGLRDTEYPLVANNPRWEMYEHGYTVHPRVMADIDNVCAINNAISIDLTGQVNSETTFGTRIINGLGGQPDVVLGAMLSKGGQSIHCLPSTALNGAVSRIVTQFEPGQLVTIPRYYADYVVTEYGVAKLFGKSIRQRADALISIAHPDFRKELSKEAKRLFYP